MSRLKWSCETCGKDGPIRRKPHEDTDSVISRIDAKHKKVSPSCESPVDRIKISVVLPKRPSVRDIHRKMVIEDGIIPH